MAPILHSYSGAVQVINNRFTTLISRGLRQEVVLTSLGRIPNCISPGLLMGRKERPTAGLCLRCESPADRLEDSVLSSVCRSLSRGEGVFLLVCAVIGRLFW